MGYQNKGVGTELLAYLTYLAKRRGLFGFSAEVLMENRPMLHLFRKMGFDIEKKRYGRVYELELMFTGCHRQADLPGWLPETQRGDWVGSSLDTVELLRRQRRQLSDTMVAMQGNDNVGSALSTILHG